MRNRHMILSISVLLLAAAGGCEREQGPAEQAGENIDEAVEDTGQQLEQATEQATEQAEQLEQATEQATEQAGQKLEEAGDRLRQETTQ